MDLREKVSSLPVLPGVYKMKDADGHIIYVGKAKNLRSRVRSYFHQDAQHDLKTQFLVSKILDFEIIVTGNELEALVLENTLIKRLKPKFNIRLKDDKTYPFVKINFQESFPRLEFTRKFQPGKNIRYFGPFPWGNLSRLIRAINHTYQLRDCSDNKFKNRSRPCLSYQMKICTAPCVDYVSTEDYKLQIENAVKLLNGNSEELAEKLRAEMAIASENMDFEQAALLRDQIVALESLNQEQKVAHLAGIKDRDIVGVVGDAQFVCISILIVRNGNTIDKKSFVWELGLQSFPEILDTFLVQYYSRHDLPTEVLLPFEPESSLEDIQAALTEIKKAPQSLKVHIPAEKGDLRELTKLAMKNGDIDLLEHKRKVETRWDDLGALQKELELEKKPYRIECYDISTLQGDSNVASRVVFVQGQPSPEDYRRYKLQTVEGIDDFKSMSEVLSRRFSHIGADWPDLVVIDGGRGQLGIALQVMAELGVRQVPVVGLAKSRVASDFQSAELSRKQERVFLPNRVNPIILKEGSGAYRVLTQIRDEAHRFAISYNRLLRKKKNFDPK